MSIRQFPKRPVAQKQSARLISGRPRSVTAPDDHLTIRKPKSENRKDSHENCQGTQIEEPTGRRHRPIEGTSREAEFTFHQAEVRLRQPRGLDAAARQARRVTGRNPNAEDALDEFNFTRSVNA